MKRDSDLNCENFQDLRSWCSAAPSVDSFSSDPTKPMTEDSTWTTLAVEPQLGQSSFFTTTPRDALSPVTPDDLLTDMFSYPIHTDMDMENQLLDISQLPIVIEDEAPVPETLKNYNNIITQKDSLLGFGSYPKVIGSFTPQETDETMISEYIIDQADKKIKIESDILLPYNTYRTKMKNDKKLRLNILNKVAAEPALDTPDILNTVEEMEAEKFGQLNRHSQYNTLADYAEPSTSDTVRISATGPIVSKLDLEQPKEETLDSDEDHYRYSPAIKPTKRRRHISEDSDESYTPSRDESPPRKNKRKVIVKFPQQEPRVQRRGRPPKRRDSITSTSTVDDSHSNVSTEEMRYRELRDKNNKASQRSRFNRKLKEREMVKLGDELEERNKKLRVKAQVLEELTKKLKQALLTSILGKQMT